MLTFRMIEQMEDNENSFVGLWSERISLNCATVYVNLAMMEDPFFNRVTDIDCEEFSEMLNAAEREYAKRKAKEFIYCLSNERLEAELQKQNFVLYDTMSVLLYESPYKLRYSPDIKIKEVNRNEILPWISVFCSSFNVEKESDVSRIISNSFNSMRLYLAYMKDFPAGCVAVFEKNSLLGLYCFGVLSKYKGKGVATALISVCADIAKERDLKLFLQSFQADSLINYYIKRGFTQIYTKRIYRKI